MSDLAAMKLLFIINNASGVFRSDWQSVLNEYFSDSAHEYDTYTLDASPSKESIKQMIAAYKPHRVIAVGGDGTVKLVAECLLFTAIPLGILPAGSSNGMAKELQIPESATRALEIILNGIIKKVHLIQINNEWCIHLSDIGLNALMISVFNNGIKRGKLGYLLAAISVLWNYPRMKVVIQPDNDVLKMSAVMIVIANATMYGTGALINPIGKLNDDLFEVIVINKISFMEIYKMMVSHKPFDTAKTTVFQTRQLQITISKKAHFQVDGEYFGKVNNIRAKILTDALQIIIPNEKISCLN